MAEELNVPLLGSLPLDPVIARSCDEGLNPITENPGSVVIKNLNSIISSNFVSNFFNYTRILFCNTCCSFFRNISRFVISVNELYDPWGVYFDREFLFQFIIILYAKKNIFYCIVAYFINFI